MIQPATSSSDRLPPRCTREASGWLSQWALLIASAVIVIGGGIDAWFIRRFMALGTDRPPEALTLLLAQMGAVGASVALASSAFSLLDDRTGKCTAFAAALLMLLAAGLTLWAARL